MHFFWSTAIYFCVLCYCCFAISIVSTR